METNCENSSQKTLLNEDDIKFLKELQSKMNAQDTCGTASPRFWVIKGTEKQYGIEDGYEDGSDLVSQDDGTVVASNMKEAFEYIRDELLDEMNATYIYERTIDYDEKSNNITISWSAEELKLKHKCSNLSEIAEWLSEMHYEHICVNYRIVYKIYPDTMFLTLRDAEAHLAANYYHYSEDAHAYAMMAWRSPVVKQLFEILERTDWEALKK